MRAKILRRAIAFVAPLLAGCSSDEFAGPPTLDPSAILGRIDVTPSVAIFAVGQTEQLTVAAQSLAGAQMSGFDSISYALQNRGDTAQVQLSSAGLLTGRSPSAFPVIVNVIAYRGNAAKCGQAVVQTTALAEAGLTLSIQPVAPDSARLAAGQTKTIVAVIRNPETGASIADPVMRYASSDPNRLAVYEPNMWLPYSSWGTEVPCYVPTREVWSPGDIRAMTGEGTVWVYATASVYGTVLRDSVLYTLTYPFTSTIATSKQLLGIASTLASQTVSLAPGASVTFRNSVASSDPLRIAYTFDNPAGATATSPASSIGGASGNVTPLNAGQTSRRRFMTAGTYKWTATASGGPAPWNGQTLGGTIVIK